jgi:hypothetical protein
MLFIIPCFYVTLQVLIYIFGANHCLLPFTFSQPKWKIAQNSPSRRLHKIMLSSEQPFYLCMPGMLPRNPAIVRCCFFWNALTIESFSSCCGDTIRWETGNVLHFRFLNSEIHIASHAFPVNSTIIWKHFEILYWIPFSFFSSCTLLCS